MRIIRAKPAKGKPRKIICSGCGKRAREAGVAVPDDAVEQVVARDIMQPGWPVVTSEIIDEDAMQRLCEECLTALERAEQR